MNSDVGCVWETPTRFVKDILYSSNVNTKKGYLATMILHLMDNYPTQSVLLPYLVTVIRFCGSEKIGAFCRSSFNVSIDDVSSLL